jgi:hypothetical protein
MSAMRGNHKSLQRKGQRRINKAWSGALHFRARANMREK